MLSSKIIVEEIVLHQIGLGNNIDATSTEFSAASEENSWKLENFTTWLLSEANDIQVGAKVMVESYQKCPHPGSSGA